MNTEKAIEILESVSWSGYEDKEIAEAVQMGADALKEQRPHGEWIEKCWNDPRYVDYECSVCKRSIMNGTPDFCPNCGADMREGDGSDRA